MAIKEDYFEIYGEQIDIHFVARRNRPEPRVCIREEFKEIIHILKGCTPSGNKANNVKKWTFHYNDGTVETVILRERILNDVRIYL